MPSTSLTDIIHIPGLSGKSAKWECRSSPDAPATVSKGGAREVSCFQSVEKPQQGLGLRELDWILRVTFPSMVTFIDPGGEGGSREH